MFWYTMGHDDLLRSSPRAIGHFDLGPDPVKMSQLAAGALLFLRADVKAAQKSVDRSYTRTQVYESLRLKYAESPLYTPGFAPATMLLHGSRIASLDAAAAAEANTAAPAEPFRSDTNELSGTARPRSAGWSSSIRPARRRWWVSAKRTGRPRPTWPPKSRRRSARLP